MADLAVREDRFFMGSSSTLSLTASVMELSGSEMQERRESRLLMLVLAVGSAKKTCPPQQAQEKFLAVLGAA